MIKLADTLAPMADFPAAMAEHIEFSDGENLQQKLDDGSLGGGGTSATTLKQSDYNDLDDQTKVENNYLCYDTGVQYIKGVAYGKPVDDTLSTTSTNAIQNAVVAEKFDGILNTYISIGDLNTRKGTSVSLVAGEDNTLKIIDALEPREQFIDWFGNSLTANRFGIDTKIYGITINELRVIKVAVDSIVTAIMSSGAVLSRICTGGTLGNWTSTGHTLTDGYTDDGTVAITGQNEDSSGMYGNGVLPETLGFTRDTMTWNNGIYKISHGVDLVGLPDNLQAGRLEHFNLKRWGSNHNPHTQTWAERISIFYAVNGNIYTRVQASGATAGVVTTDTGWRCVTQNTKGLVTNAQNFKIDLTKRNSAWYGMFTFNFVYGTTPCEITVAITDKVYYTITKGLNIVSALTYTQDGANYTIGIDFTAKVYGTQVVEMPSEFGVINSLSASSYVGDTTAILKGYDGITYTTLAELGLTSSATIQNVMDALPVGGSCLIRTDAFDDTTQFMDVTWGYLKIEKTVNGLSKMEICDVISDNKLYIGRQSSGKFNKWVALTTIISLSQLGLTADATLNDAIAKLGVGQTATLTTMEFTNYQTLFPYEEEQDAYATVRIEKGYDANGSRTIVKWVRKDASKIAYGGLDSTNKVAWWNEYALKEKFKGRTVKSITIDLSASDLNSTLSGLNNISLENYISGSAKVIRAEGYYNPPSDATYYYKSVIKTGDSSDSSGTISYNGTNYQIRIVGGTNKGSGYAKLYYVE